MGLPEPAVKPLGWAIGFLIVLPVTAIDELVVKPVRWLLRQW